MSTGRVPVTAVVITRNEEVDIVRCLEHLRFCSETVVVDSGSTDRTRELAARFTDKVISLPWAGFAAQKNHAIKYISFPWVLSVDADEVVPVPLQKEIEELFSTGKARSFGAFSVPRKTIHFGRWIRHGGWYPNRLVRLFDAAQGRWEGEELHERWVSSGPVGELRHDLEHYSFRDLTDQVGRNNRYSSLGAQKLRREGKHFSIRKMVSKPLSKFLETYLLKRGFLDGYPGFIISISAAYSVFLKWAKLWELENGKPQV